MTNGQKRSFRIVSLGDSPFPDLIPKADTHESNKNCFFFIRLTETDDLSLVEIALRSEVPKDQLLIYGSPGKLPSSLSDPKIKFLLDFPGEPKQSFKIRLQFVLEEMRNSVLGTELEFAREEMDIGQLNAEDWLDRQGAAHIAHAFSKNLDLPLFESRNIIKAALRKSHGAEATQLEPLSRVMVELSFLAWKHKASSHQFREEFRKVVSLLSFKQKSELREACETSLEKFWGKNEAA